MPISSPAEMLSSISPPFSSHYFLFIQSYLDYEFDQDGTLYFKTYLIRFGAMVLVVFYPNHNDFLSRDGDMFMVHAKST